MSLDSLIQEYNMAEERQFSRLRRMFDLMRDHPRAVLVIGGSAGEEHTEELRSFNAHQLTEFMERRGRRDVTFWSLGSSE